MQIVAECENVTPKNAEAGMEAIAYLRRHYTTIQDEEKAKYWSEREKKWDASPEYLFQLAQTDIEEHVRQKFLLKAARQKHMGAIRMLIETAEKKQDYTKAQKWKKEFLS